MRIIVATLVAFGLAVTVAVLYFADDTYQWGLPPNVPAPPVPNDNPMTDTKVELGRWLFYDTRLSVNGTMSCGNCHFQRLAFTDARRTAVGATGESHPRGSMSLVNVAYASRLTWANHLLDRLEVQALTPLFGEAPVEMGMAGREGEITALLRADPLYAEWVPERFQAMRTPIRF